MYAINSNQDAIVHYGILIRINGIHSHNIFSFLVHQIGCTYTVIKLLNIQGKQIYIHKTYAQCIESEAWDSH